MVIDEVDGSVRREPCANAVLGDGSLLVTLSRRGAVEQAWWPNLDRDPNLRELRLFAVGLDGSGDEGGGRGVWLDDAGLRHDQRYDGNTSVLVTEVSGAGVGRVTVTDVVAAAAPVLVRRVSGLRGRLGVSVVPELMGQERANGGYLDRGTGALLFHRQDRWLALGMSVATQPELGLESDGSARAARLLTGRLLGSGVAHGRVDGTLLAREPGDEIVVAAAFADSAESALGHLREVLDSGASAVIAARRDADARLIAAATPTVVDGAAAELDRRSQLVLSMVADRETGGVLAGPEVDPDFVRSGGYGFVWPRDLAFILLAQLAAGRRDLAVPALRWLVRAQAPDGLWLHRQWTDGTLAPSWGIQLDETGAVLVAYDLAWSMLADGGLDAELWPSAARAADALVATLDPETGLPAPSMDLWEERVGLHTYSSAAVCAGLRAAARMAGRHDPSRSSSWFEAADRVQAGIEAHLWSEEHGRFLRSLSVARDDADGAPTPSCHDLLDGQPAAPDRPRSVDPVDATIDVSLLGLAYPFGVLPMDDPRMAATAEAVDRELTTSDGGLLRYTGDGYIGGNPWVLARLWAGLARRAPGDPEPAVGIDYALRSATSTQLLPEQVDVATGEPAWVVPLTWSHAMYVLAARPDVLALRRVAGLAV